MMLSSGRPRQMSAAISRKAGTTSPRPADRRRHLNAPPPGLKSGEGSDPSLALQAEQALVEAAGQQHCPMQFQKERAVDDRFEVWVHSTVFMEDGKIIDGVRQGDRVFGIERSFYGMIGLVAEGIDGLSAPVIGSGPYGLDGTPASGGEPCKLRPLECREDVTKRSELAGDIEKQRHSTISNTARFLFLAEAAPRIVRIALAVRPCFPITLPRSPWPR